MSAHPLLTRVLARAMHKRGHPTHQQVFAEVAGRPGDYCYDEAVWTVAEIRDDDDGPDIADRLERALDVCQRMDPDPAIGQCGETEASEVHHRDLSVWPSESFWAHPFVPLVTP